LQRVGLHAQVLQAGPFVFGCAKKTNSAAGTAGSAGRRGVL